MSNSENKNYIPLLAAGFTLLGLFLGKILYQNGDVLSFSSTGKVEEVLDNVSKRYVDSVDIDLLTDDAITHFLQNLDPHSTYLPASKVPQEQERMRGDFVGIGIEYQIIDDTIMVVWPIEDGPSEQAGMLAGDRIIGIEGVQLTITKASTDSLIQTLRGQAGTEFMLMVYRPFNKQTLELKITRAEIPMYSVDAHFMLDNSIGYLKINRFSHKTYQEVVAATDDLIQKGAKSLMIDVRENPGGALDAVIDVCNEFLAKGDKILTTKGLKDQEEFIADGSGKYQNIPLAILVNQYSASASEILAGALQDNDRAHIVGRRTFGKGLVQAVIPLKDKSRINLTIARYYIPSGRSIQKPYGSDDVSTYREDMKNRWESGELTDEGKINMPDSLKYYTKNKRVVFGGGGIVPDFFMPIDTNSFKGLYAQIQEKNLIRAFILRNYFPQTILAEEYDEAFTEINTDELEQRFRKHLSIEKINYTEKEWIESKDLVMNYLIAYAFKLKFGNEGYYKVVTSLDKEILRAGNILENNIQIVKK